MASEHSKPRIIMTSDRLSMLPDDLTHKILSFTSTKHAIQTSALSSRWRFIWTSMPYLNISSTTDQLPHFPEFVNHVLSHRNDQIDLDSVNLSFCRWTYSDILLKTILHYAFSHNVQRLTLSITYNDKIEFPPCLFRSPSLKYLSLVGSSHRSLDAYSIILASTWDLPALTTLHLDYVAFHEDDGTGNGILSKCANLENLTLVNFKILESRNPTLYHPKLSNLTLENGHWTTQHLNVAAPQLKSLTIRSCYGKHVIAAPNLASLLFHSKSRLRFSTDLPSLEMVDLCICSRHVWTPCRIACLLHQLLNVKFLKLNLEFLEPLNSCLEEISLQPSPFSNLKSLKVYPVCVTLDDEPQKRIILSTKVINFLLDGSPGATFTLISYEETKEKMQKARALANAAEAQRLMTNLQVLLEKEKGNIETHMNQPVEADAHDQGKSQVKKVQLQFERKVEQMQRCWEDVGVQIDQGRRSACDIISRLHDIEVLLLKDLPASKRDELQACFSSLCAEVDSVVKKISHRMKIPQIHLSDCFNELATISISSS